MTLLNARNFCAAKKHLKANSIQYVPHPPETKGMAQAILLAEPFIHRDEKNHINLRGRYYRERYKERS